MKILRLFSQFRRMETELNDLESSRIKAEDDVRSWRARAELFEQRYDDARKESEKILKRLTDWTAIMAGQPPVFGSIPIPDQSEDEPRDREPRKMRGRSLAALAEAEFQRNWEEAKRSRTDESVPQ